MQLKNFITLTCICFVGIRGFLLDDRTTPSSSINTGLSDNHYDIIMAVISSEREARKKLERRVEFLEQELQATEKGVTELYHLNQAFNQTISGQNNKINILVAENNALQGKHNAFKSEIDELKINFTQIQSVQGSIRQQVVSLQQLKGVSDLQAVLVIQNEMKHLDGELKVTSSKVNSMAVDVEARKQDFMALFSQASATEKNLEQAEASLNRTLTSIIQHQNLTTTDIKDELNRLSEQQNTTAGNVASELRNLSARVSTTFQHHNQTMNDITNELTKFSKYQNKIAGKVEWELRNMSGRAILTSCALGKTYSDNDKILFPDVHTKSGISNNIIDDFGKTGVFEVEKPGLYLISAFIMTRTVGHVYFTVYKKGVIIGYGFTDVKSNFQTATVVVIEHMNTNDTLYVTTFGSPVVYGGPFSCTTLLQLTEDI